MATLSLTDCFYSRLRVQQDKNKITTDKIIMSSNYFLLIAFFTDLEIGAWYNSSHLPIKK